MYKKTNLTTPLQIFHSLIPVDTELMYINIVCLYQSSYIRFMTFYFIIYILYGVTPVSDYYPSMRNTLKIYLYM